jgi:hypothetical protein
VRAHFLQLTAAVASACIALGSAARSDAQSCACGSSECPSVTVGEDDWTDLGCAESTVGQTLPDSDSDGIPDACDRCACAPNPLAADTGRPGECPATTPPPQPPVEPALSPIRCVDGRVTGIPAHATVWRLRPILLAFSRFEEDSHEVAAGAHLLVLRNMNIDECETIDVGGKLSVKRYRPSWHLRGGAVLAAAASLGQLDADVALALDGGIDYRPRSGWWALGPALHVMTLLGSADPTPFFIGLGPRLDVLDTFALTPFVQLNASESFEPSYGLWIAFDFGALEDLGLSLDAAAQ